MEENERKEILFYYESRQNPNGDPGFENQPRKLPDDRIIVTDVRIKRTIRDYAKNHLNKPLFVDFGKEGYPIKPDERVEEIRKSKHSNENTSKVSGDDYTFLLKDTFDVPLFGALVPIKKPKNKDDKDGNKDKNASNKESEELSSFKVTGPVQFGIGYSVNKPEIISPMISSLFVGRKEKEKYGTFGRFYSVKYALIKVHAAINPMNLKEFFSKDEDIKKAFDESENHLFECLWDGTNSLVTRSKYPQRSVLYIEVTYNNYLFNDLPYLVKEKETLTGKNVEKLDPSGFDFTDLINRLKERKAIVKQVRIVGCDELRNQVEELTRKLKEAGIKVVEEVKAN